jgi:4-amino-4-deoxy-L-arabinose transferase-like glycosyltransferase
MTRTDRLWFFACGIASSAWCVLAAFQLGATFDEPIYLQRGLETWRTGSHQGLLRLGTMPLPVDVCTLPLYLAERRAGTPFDPIGDMERILPWARLGTLLFGWLLLFFGWRIGWMLAGRWGGRLGVALLACEPSLLAHASLATTDIALTACVLGLIYFFQAARETDTPVSWSRRVGLPAVWFGLAVLAKASGLVYGVLCLTFLELERLWRTGALARPEGRSWPRQIWDALRPLRRDLTQIVALGMVLVFVYCGSDWQAEASFVDWAHELPEGAMRDGLVWFAESLRVFPNAAEGIVRQVKHNVHGHGTYLLGHGDARALWYYFPVLLTIKLSLPVLLLAGAAALVRPKALCNWATLTAAVLVLFSLTFRVQIGIRMVFPVVVLLVLGVAAAVVRIGLSSTSMLRRHLLAGVTAAGVLWAAWSALAVWPNGLCYVNEAWGGTRDGYRLVSDANYDWGQGLPELARWQTRRGGDRPLDVWYFGTDAALLHLPLREVPLHVLPLGRPEDVLGQVHSRYLAVSTTLLYGNCMTPSQGQAVMFLRRFRPVDRTQTFLIFELRAGAAGEQAAGGLSPLPPGGGGAGGEGDLAPEE